MLAAPNFANYRLGPLAGSTCDTIITIGAKVSDNFDELTVFPNPSKEKVHIRLKQQFQTPSQITILNATGQVVFIDQIDEEYTSLDAISLGIPSGIYTICVQNNRQTWAKKWVLNY